MSDPRARRLAREALTVQAAVGARLAALAEELEDDAAGMNVEDLGGLSRTIGRELERILNELGPGPVA